MSEVELLREPVQGGARSSASPSRNDPAIPEAVRAEYGMALDRRADERVEIGRPARFPRRRPNAGSPPASRISTASAARPASFFAVSNSARTPSSAQRSGTCLWA